MDFLSLPEEPLKNAIRERYFQDFACSGDQIDFRISAPQRISLIKSPPLYPVFQKDHFKSTELKRARLQSEITGMAKEWLKVESKRR
ncbi:hypothetical protein NHP190003_01240 [Helicobacter sp. NHP19-003]|uniref:Uncharacterized protein n=1 Tax=Helicobacter gastrocanis TaxID=2849641 RepID=A0ABN6I1Y6_9HELI|nr:hypothetical protein [Helicobacter sp. NHP19-003]BCZ16842.1 hypothetical protein NHP190003_01240 [Helicobacter sp. NHP19-003]